MADQFERVAAALEGRFRLESELGSGGMATVYLAEDARHRRHVAIKVLRPDLAATLGSERFHREIEIAAQLQHPHVLPLLDSGEAGDFFYYVMPFVEGESLREKIDREGALPIGDAVRILRDVVDALTEAHQVGVVHRDIKPENIMLRGRHAMVMDFGVAKAVTEATGRSQLTTAGVALGTPPYMAPEQATADPHIDHRVDIYAVGCVAYELLTGRTVFMGSTPQMVLSAHVTEAPMPVRERRDTVAPELDALVMKCLEKKAGDRWQTAEELLAQLEVLATPSGGTTPTQTRPLAATAAHKNLYRRTAVLVLTVGLAIFALTLSGRGGVPDITFGQEVAVTTEDGLEVHPSISPDGNLVAYASGPSALLRVHVRPVGGGRAVPLADDSAEVQAYPRWSPDGREILFVAVTGAFDSFVGGPDYTLKIAPITGGTARILVRSSQLIDGATWIGDGSAIAFVRNDSLIMVRPDGEPISAVSTGMSGLHSCRFAPLGMLLACVEGNRSSVRMGQTFGNLAPSRIVLISAETGEVVPVTTAEAAHYSPAWSADARYLYFVSDRQGSRDVYAVAIDGERVDGDPVRLSTGMDALSIDVTRDGSQLVYSDYTTRANLWSLPIPASGTVDVEDAIPVTTGSQIIEASSVSFDRRWLVYDSNLRGRSNIYRVPLGGGEPEQLTRDPFDQFAPDLSPDGSMLIYHSFESGTRDIYVRPVGSGAAQRVTVTDDHESYPRWSPDGRSIVYYEQRRVFSSFVVTRAGGGWSEPVDVGRMAIPAWSPTGDVLVGGVPGTDSIAVASSDGQMRRTIHVQTPDLRQLSRVNFDDTGDNLIFKTFNRQGQTEFWTMPLSGADARLLVRFTDPRRQSNRNDFSTDGRNLYFTIEDRQSDISVIELVTN